MSRNSKTVFRLRWIPREHIYKSDEKKETYISQRRKSTVFSIDVSLNMATFNGTSRKTGALRGKIAESELGIMVNEGFYKKASYHQLYP